MSLAVAGNVAAAVFAAIVCESVPRVISASKFSDSQLYERGIVFVCLEYLQKSELRIAIQ